MEYTNLMNWLSLTDVYIYVTNTSFKIWNISVILESSCMYLGIFSYLLMLVSSLITLRADYVVFVLLNNWCFLGFAFRSRMVHPASCLPKVPLFPYKKTLGFSGW